MNRGQVEWLMNATPEKRYRSFLSSVAEGNDIWYLFGREGGFMRFEDDGYIDVPLWAYSEFSDYFKSFIGADSDATPHSHTVTEFFAMADALDEYVRFMVFPTKKDAYTVTCKQLCEDLQKALDERFMQEALLVSKSAVMHGNEPFGAVLVKDEKIVFSNENQIYTKNDPTFHAEMGLIRRFCEEKGISDLSGYTLYSSCEPCFMCSGAMVWSKLSRLVYGASNTDLEEILGNKGCECSAMVFENSFRRPEVTGGVLREESKEILRSYFSNHKKG